MKSEKLYSFKEFAWLFLLLCFLVPQLVCAQYTEYEIKAAYIEKLSRFIEWPESSAFSDTSQPFVIGVLGKNPFNHILEDAFTKYKIKDRKVVIRYYSSTIQINHCHLLFVSVSERKNLSAILERIKGKPILTISDSEGFAQRGVHINLYLKYKKLHYEINESALVKSGFSVWAQLLSSAKIVNPLKR